MKRKIEAKFFSLFLLGFLLAAASASAQSIAYRQTNLASDVTLPGSSNLINLTLRNSWGLAVVPRKSFFVANASNGLVLELDATGSGTGPAGFHLSNTAGTGNGSPAAAIADPDALFLPGGVDQRPIISILTATQDGGIYNWIVDSRGNFQLEGTLVIDHSRDGAVYTGIAILKPACCTPILAVANFHSGRVETYDTHFALLGSFLDPGLPAGFAPYGMQIIGNQLFVASALQDAAKHDPVAGAGNGMVSVFDLQGQFVRRFATAGPLNTPWGITQASANFGPFSNDILIGNIGDGTINAFDLATGNFAGQLKDGDGFAIVNDGLHGLAFRSDGIGDPNTLYFTAGIANGRDGLFGAITSGMVSTTRVSVPPTPSDGVAPITVTVSAEQGNTGTPTGNVAVQDGGIAIAHVALQNGMIVFPAILTKVGNHIIQAQYEGDATFLPSTSNTEVEVTLISTRLTLTAPANAAPGATLELTAITASGGGIPTGAITFLDGNTNLGTVPVDGTGAAVLRVNTLAPGVHTLTATYGGDGKFGVSTSAPVTTTIIGKDFSVGAAPPSTTVTAGQSTSFNLTITPTDGFADAVTFSCPVLTGITCAFNPPTVTPNGAAVSTMLTVTTSAGVTRYGQAVGRMGSGGAGFLLASLALIAALAMLKKSARRPHLVFVRVAASALTVFALAFTLISCGGYTTSGQANRGTASIVVTAHSGALSHTTNISVTVQ